MATDINIMEFVTAVLAVFQERDYLRGRTILLRIDNTSAVSWFNKMRAKHVEGQLWMATLITTLLDYDITLLCEHIPGEENRIADGLSRYFQEVMDELAGYRGWVDMTMPNSACRRDMWRPCSGDLTEMLTSILTRPGKQEPRN